MKFHFITPRLHGLLDYAAAIALIVLPVLLDLGSTSPIALWLSIGGGVGLIGYSLLTDYPFGVGRAVDFRTHLVLDLAAAAAFFLAPFVFDWYGLTEAYYFVMGAGVLVVVAFSTPEPASLADVV